MTQTDALKIFKSLGMNVDTKTPGKVVVSSRGAKSHRGLQPFPKSFVEHLNAAKEGSLLGVLAVTMRDVSQVPRLPSGRVPYHALTGLLGSLRELNCRLADEPITVHASFTLDRPIRLFLSPQSSNRDVRTVFEIMNASEAGKVDRLKVCEYCQRFFIARRNVARFCPGGPCRKNWHRRTPAGKRLNQKHQRQWRERDRRLRYESK